jgi:hypothetical protein
MRRAVVLLIGVLGLLLSAGPASAAALRYAPSPTPGTPGDGGTPLPTPSVGQTVCTISEKDMTELSGLVATPSGYALINDSNGSADAMKVFFLDSSCKRKGVVSYPPRPRDPEDLAIQSDGTMWVADTGDNLASPSRPNIALWKVPPGGTGKMTLFRFQYPDGAHDCEALLLAKDGAPIFVTKVVSGAAGIYMPEGALDPSGTAVHLKKVGQFQPQRTGTDNPLGVAGQNSVTGGANSPDSKRVALRTYSDAYEWDVPDGDVLKAITTGKPRVTPLPREPLGEAIAYSPDGASFLTVADQLQSPTKILRYKPASTIAPVAKAQGAAVPAPRGDTRSWFDKLSLRQITYLVAGIGLIGVLFVLVGVLGIRRSRQERQLAAMGTVRGTATVGSATEPVDGSDDAAWAEDDSNQPTPSYPDDYGEGVYRSGGSTTYPDHPGTVYGGQRYDDGYDHNPRSDYSPRR